jgi:hypothetical protein
VGELRSGAAWQGRDAPWPAVGRPGARETMPYVKKVDAFVFAEVWNASRSPQEAAERLGMKLSSAKTRAIRMRASGVELVRHAEGDGRRSPPAEAINARLRRRRKRSGAGAP